MNIHEYQAKKILSQYGIKIPKGGVAYTPTETKKIAARSSLRGPWVVKAQIQSGARKDGYFIEKAAGSRGGIRIVKSRKDVFTQTEKMLGATLVTVQTGPKGKPVSRVYIENFEKVIGTFYAGIAVDRVQATLTLLISRLKDKEITQIAVSNPEQILRIPLELKKEVRPEQVQKILDYLKLSPKSAKALEIFVNGLHKAFIEKDATMIEVNPAGVKKSGEIVALDAKISFDDNALYRHKDISRLKDDYENSERELQAAKYRFTYSEFDGSVGCIVNGDGIALAAMDLLRSKGVGTACFLNVKGGVDKDNIASGIKIIMTNPRVEGILINILGGFLRCNLIADGILSAASEVGLNVPLVVRFEGTNKEEAKEILERSKLPIIIAETMEEAVDKLIEAMEESD